MNDKTYDIMAAFELMSQGKINGYFCQGFNPLMSFPNKNKVRQALGKLKFLVVMDPLQTETARFWENHGEFNVNEPAKVQTEAEKAERAENRESGRQGFMEAFGKSAVRAAGSAIGRQVIRGVLGGLFGGGKKKGGLFG